MSGIPTYQLSTLQEAAAQPSVYLLGPHTPLPKVPISVPYRSNYYKVGICLRGRAELKVDLETYVLEPGCLLVLSPHMVKQWRAMPADFESLSIFFTQEFMAAGSSLSLDQFAFYAGTAAPVLPLPASAAASVQALLELLAQHYTAAHPYRPEVLRHLIGALLYEAAAAYGQAQPTAPKVAPGRPQLIAAEFRRLLPQFGATERSLSFYASKLCISPKYLAETVREVTGRRATEWLADMAVLEAQVLLHDPALPIGQVADQLGFADQSAFGRFFKKHTGRSPAAYRATAG